MEGSFTLSQQVGMEVGAVICHFLKWPFCPTHWENRRFSTISPRDHILYFRGEARIAVYLEQDKDKDEDSKWSHGWIPSGVKVEWIDLLDEHRTAFRTTTISDFSRDENGIWRFASGFSEERIY